MQLRRLVLPFAALALVGGVAVSSPADAKTPAPRAAWASAATAAIHPGVQTITNGAQCTANFVFSDGTSYYLGQAAHCSGTGAATDTNGCSAKSLPLDTKVAIAGTNYSGPMVYNSWLAMQKARTTDANTCAYNDLALIKLDAAAVAATNPSVPFFGGPTGVSDGNLPTGATVVSYGNSSLRLGLSVLSPKYGRVLFTDSGGWNHSVYTVTPGIPGDSGSGFMDAGGKAFGVLSTVELAPYALSNGVGDLSREIAFAQAHGMPGLALVNGTVGFSGAL